MAGTHVARVVEQVAGADPAENEGFAPRNDVYAPAARGTTFNA